MALSSSILTAEQTLTTSVSPPIIKIEARPIAVLGIYSANGTLRPLPGLNDWQKRGTKSDNSRAAVDELYFYDGYYTSTIDVTDYQEHIQLIDTLGNIREELQASSPLHPAITKAARFASSLSKYPFTYCLYTAGHGQPYAIFEIIRRDNQSVYIHLKHYGIVIYANGLDTSYPYDVPEALERLNQLGAR